MRLEKITQPNKNAEVQISPISSSRLHKEFIGGLVVSGNRVISSSEDSHLVATQAMPFVPEEVVLRLKMPINHIALSPDGSLLAAAADDKNIYLIDTEDWEVVRTIKGHDSYVTKVAFADDKLISISHDASIKIWNYKTSELLQTLTGHGEWVYRMAVSPDNKYLLTTSNNCSAKVWDLATGQEVKHLVDGSAIIYASDGISLMIGGSNDTGTGNKSFVRSALWAENGMVYTCARDVVCWDSQDWSIKWQIDCSYDVISDLVYLPEQDLLIAVSDIIYGIDARTGEVRFSQKNLESVAIYSCGMVGRDYLVTGDELGNVSVWNIHDLAAQGVQVSFGGDVYRPKYIPSAKRIIAGSWLGGLFSIWSQQGQFIKDIKGFDASTDNQILAALPNSPHQLVATGKGEVKIIDVIRATVSDVIRLDKPNLRVTEAIWINDKEFIVSCTSNLPRLINIETKEVKVIKSNYTLGGDNYRLSDELFLFQLSYYRRDQEMPEDANYSDISFMVGEGQSQEIMEGNAPLLVYNVETKEIMHQWWMPAAKKKPKGAYSNDYAWPIVGGPDNMLVGATYSVSKKQALHIWQVGKEKPIKSLKLKKYARSGSSFPYGVFANEDMFLFRIDDLGFRYEVASKKWSDFRMVSNKSSYHKEKQLLALAENYYTLVLWDVKDWKKVYSKRFKFKIDSFCFGDEQLYIYTEQEGFLIYNIHID